MNEGHILENAEKAFNYLLENEIQYGIVTTLSIFGSLNQRQVSFLINKPEPTIFRHMKQLIARDFLELDSKKTSSHRGQFYCLSANFIKLAQQSRKEEENWEEEIVDYVSKLKNLLEKSKTKKLNTFIINRFRKMFQEDKVMKQLRISNSLTANIQNAITNNIRLHLKKLAETADEEEIEDDSNVLRSHISANSLIIPTYKTAHYVKLYDIMTDYFKKLKDLKDEIEKERASEKIAHEDCVNQYISSFGGSIDSKYLK